MDKKTEAFKMLVKNLNSLMEFREKFIDKTESNDSEYEEQEENEDDELCSACINLSKTIEGFMRWCFGKGPKGGNIEDLIKRWKRENPTKEIPDIFSCKNLDSHKLSCGLLIQYYPEYVEQKSRSCKCDNAN